MKRLLTIIIVLAMCMALLPTAVFAAEVVTTPTVDFNSVSLGSKTGATLNSAMNGADLRILAHNFTEEEVPVFSPDKEKVTMAVTYTVEVTDSGTYIPEITYAPSKYSPKVEVFLSKGALTGTYVDAVCALDSGARLGIFDAYSEADIYPDSGRYQESCDGKNPESIETRTTKFPAVSLEAGTYSLTLVLNDANADMSLLEGMKLTNNGTETTYSYLTTLYLDKFTLAKPSEKANPINYVIKPSALKDTSITSLSSSTTGGVLSLVSWIEKTDTKYLLDEDKTDGYQLVDRVSSSTYFNSHRFEPNGLVVQFKTAQYGKDYAKYGIRLNVTTRGTYQLSVSNDHNATDTYPKLYATNGQMTSGLIAKVRLAKVKSGEEATATSEAAANTYTYMNNALATGEVNLGEWWYDSNKVGQTQICPTNVTLEQGEYFIIFEANSESIAKNPTMNGSSQQALLISGITLTPVESAEDNAQKNEQAEYDKVKNDKENAIAQKISESGLDSAACINIVGADVADYSSVADATQRIDTTRGSDMEITAKSVDGYEFLYWAKGLGKDRRVVSTDKKYTVKAISGGTWLYAYYKKIESTDVSVMFYNADGSVIKQYVTERDSVIEFPETTPTLNSYVFKGWAIGSSDNLVDSAIAEGNQMLFVAQYNDPMEEQKVYKVTVNGNVSYHSYGEAVTAVAAERSGTDMFVYWTKGDEIVSFDKSYTFNVWEACELIPVYAAYNPATEILRKIIIKGDDENIMAEFIGFDSVVETGILFHETEDDITLANAKYKIAMTRDGNHLSAINDVGNYIGYAILSDNTVIYDK